ncbi:EthD family reductase [Kineococcus rhizosphaerae]|uniref:EthD domain-containing protein n=1 Tax=Kineococcus rhizosphaerae TaxID=559628 RepID=A0A2T0QWU5_9ACTN|nr:EthD family reductase [Kineococcus rhizosphaerae]PRY09787.1 hypothetical protein CLV37_12039 [Kineococcus rhizosphaerae]
MTTKITFVVDNPSDPAAFESAYARVRELAGTLPLLQRLESATVWPREDGSPTPAHRTLDLHFSDYADASAAVGTPVAGELFQRLLATGTPFTALFCDVEPSEHGHTVVE